MRLGGVTFVSPQGATISCEAQPADNDGLQLWNEPFEFGSPTICVGDPGLPLTANRKLHMIAVVPIGWAITYHWEHTTPVKS